MGDEFPAGARFVRAEGQACGSACEEQEEKMRFRQAGSQDHNSEWRYTIRLGTTSALWTLSALAAAMHVSELVR